MRSLSLVSLLLFAICAYSALLPDLMHKLHLDDTQVSLKSNVHTEPKIDEDLLSLHKQLVEISSISRNETAVAEFLKVYLTAKGLTVEILAMEDGRENVYAYLGNTRDCKILLTSHIDTVPPYIPYKREGDYIYGRGSNDAKASVATQLTAFFQMLEQDELKEGDVSVLYVVSEEIGGEGMRRASKALEGKTNWETVIFGEPTENKLAVGHKGIYYFRVEVTGKASHSGYPEMGVNANYICIDIMHELQHLKYPVDDLLGPTTLNIGMFDGGVANNVISPISSFTAVIRSSVNVDQISKMITDVVIGKYAQEYGYQVSFEMIENADPSFCDYKVPGFETYIASYSTDIPNLKDTGYKRYLYGPGSILVAHSAKEYVTIDSLNQAVDDYRKLISFSL